MTQRRKTTRKHIKFYSQVMDRKTKQLLGYLDDLSLKGAMLVCDKEFSPQSILHLKIDMPDSFEQDHLNLTSQVIWSEKVPESDLFRMGIQWYDLNPEVDASLTKLFSDFA
jgi:c-di-GMP-binding flagellar brake protein YcgR